ncbi:cystathionine gamma-lyase [Niveomyces insectorum RCEF 264]|uniref:cystathionine gamma-lyase n=1 Tax=Niveomyces insectorum RCEF 264 TaxID=1081102 RepID=A0A167XVK1_9HYPO|nr:cystathionine gamma-lyase [Niveomyces insectorum RCEF 264]
MPTSQLAATASPGLQDGVSSANGSPAATTTTTTTAAPTPQQTKQPPRGFGTLAVHAGAPHDPTTGAVIEAISLSTTFAQTAVGQPVGAYEYSRSSNPNRTHFEQAVAALEHARHALAFSSGSAATATVLQALAASTTVGPPVAGHDEQHGSTTGGGSSAAGSHVISVSDVYGGTHRYFTQVAKAHGVRVTFTPAIEVDIVDHITPATRLVWIETPSNPTLRLVDIAAVARAAHARGVLVVVDNTFLSPYLQNPLDHGADVVVHSVTKYINGHSDVVMGVAACNRDDLHARLAFLQNAGGAVPSAFDSWLAHRGLKTLHLRARAASGNALQLAHALEQRSDLVLAVHYPGLDTHPQRAIARRQHRDGLGGGMLSFRVRAGRAAAARFCQYTQLFTLAESLGGIESLVEVPSSMTHAGIPRAQREAVGVYDDLVRVSCGIEDAADLLHDALQALERAAAETVADEEQQQQRPEANGTANGTANVKANGAAH